MSAKSPSTSKLKILVCGGTFDKEYDEIEGKLFFRDTHVGEMLQLGRSRLELEIEKVLMIDSLEMTDKERALVLAKCQSCEHSQILITHGTDTMEVTARTLGAAALPKTIVLTGAMIPYKFGSSDGLFNLGAALAFVQSLPPGVYIAMNGHAFDYRHVRKNRTSGRFEAI